MTPQTKLNVGDVVQLSPDLAVTKTPMFANCLMTVTEPKSFGAVGYVQSLGESSEVGGQVYYRAEWEEMEIVGRAAWWYSDGSLSRDDS